MSDYHNVEHSFTPETNIVLEAMRIANPLIIPTSLPPFHREIAMWLQGVENNRWQWEREIADEYEEEEYETIMAYEGGYYVPNQDEDELAYLQSLTLPTYWEPFRHSVFIDEWEDEYERRLKWEKRQEILSARTLDAHMLRLDWDLDDWHFWHEELDRREAEAIYKVWVERNDDWWMSRSD